MTNPYDILGVPRNAPDDEVKKAYRSLSRKYHPDANVNNPDKDWAEAKFKEIQQAYQQIMKEREYGAGGSYSQSGNTGSYGGSGPFGGFGWDFGGFGWRDGPEGGGRQSGQYSSGNEDLHLRAAMNYINSGHYREALNVLQGIKERSAQWYYYSAIANSGAGNNVLALEHARAAYQMEPDNMQYQVLVQRLQSGGSWYRTQRSPYQVYPMGGGNWCLKLCIANIVCNLCCGGGSFCCGGSGYGGGPGYGGGYV